MGTGMGTRLYPLPGGDGDETKVWYPLDLDMEMRMNFFYKDGYGIVKSVPSYLVVIPSIMRRHHRRPERHYCFNFLFYYILYYSWS